MSIGPWPQSNPPQVELTGSNAPKPSILDNVVGSYTPATQAFTAGTLTVPAGTTYNSPMVVASGYGAATALVGSASGSLSTSWSAKLMQGIPSEFSVSLTAGNTISAAGAAGSTVTANIAWPTIKVEIVNADATNALTVIYEGLWLQ